MPTIEHDDLEALSAQFGHIMMLVTHIKEKAANCQTECEQIEKHGDHIATMFTAIQARASDA
jgi:hypothetical protein